MFLGILYPNDNSKDAMLRCTGNTPAKRSLVSMEDAAQAQKRLGQSRAIQQDASNVAKDRSFLTASIATTAYKLAASGHKCASASEKEKLQVPTVTAPFFRCMS